MNEGLSIPEITKRNFTAEIVDKSHEIPVLADFWADWCAPCKMLMPILFSLAQELSGQIKLVKINTDQEAQLASEFGVRSLPTVKLFKEGKVVDEFTGMLAESAVRQFILPHLKHPAEDKIQAAAELASNGNRGEAIAMLRQTLDQHPNYEKARLALAEQQIKAALLQDARQTLDGIAQASRFDPPVKSIVARLELAESTDAEINREALEHRISLHPEDWDARGQLAAACFSEGKNDIAMEYWLQMVRSGKTAIKQNGQENLIRAFEVLGSSDQHVTRYRRLLSQALN